MKSSFTARWNEAILDEKYERWLQDPQSVDPEWAAFFEGFELGYSRSHTRGEAVAEEDVIPETIPDSLQTRVDGLVFAYRTLGHSIADLDPLAAAKPLNPLLSLKELGLHDQDLDVVVSSRYFREGRRMKLRDMILELERIYCGTIGVEFMHIQNPRTRNWMLDRIENRSEASRTDPAVHRHLLRIIHEAETFENFLHTRYVGQKRFSLEGGEALIVALTAVLENCEKRGVKEIVMGMAHRGRLNVLANFLNKPLHVLFNEFSGNFLPESVGGSGDVKYHLGFQTARKLPSGYEVQINLAANPSHLEAVSPVVEGKARARQRVLDDTAERKKVIPLLIHGDAAFIGQGVVAETFNLSQLAGYRTGGTIHIVVNNQIGFTTMPEDARSSPYCTDVAKMVDAPVLHVNGEDPIAVIQCAEIATDFRQAFGRDAVIDIYCFRRHGHNEGDEPSFTQPDLYNRIKNHPNLSEVFEAETERIGTVTHEESAGIKAESIKELESALEEVKRQQAEPGHRSRYAGSTAVYQPPYAHEPINTAISSDMIAQLVTRLTTIPEGFRVLPKLKRIQIDRRLHVWKAGGPFDWGFAEALAFGSLLLEGTPVRLSGQDSRRGTFSHRISVLYDEKTREPYIPLNHLSADQARFCVYNSPLSEYAVLGFDYGYSMDFPSMLCIWEAQFGDFVNGAQIIIDQFIASAEAKWQRPSSIVMLLPHGYEGQGPEHSSARIERFLELCADENLQVCNITTPAQYFHALRRQIHRGYRKPLIIMTPKSLLRSEQAVSHIGDFTNSRFYEILIGPPLKDPSKCERVIFCSGKVYYDLVNYREANGLTETTALIRLEQLYPLYAEKLVRETEPYRSAKKLVWCQEEPANQGAWAFIYPRLETLFKSEIAFAGRPPKASPATGTLTRHLAEQAALVKQAFEV